MKKIICIGLTVFIGLLAGLSSSNSYAVQVDMPKIPFAILKDQVPVKPPMANGFIGTCKKGYVFLIVATKELHKGDKISPVELEYVVADSSGHVFEPVAFGLPAKGAPGPFMISGFSFTGDIEIVDVDRTLFGLLFLVPKNAKNFTLRNKSSQTGTRLSVLKDFTASDSIRTGGYKMYGEIKFGFPTIEENGWGMK